MAFSIMPPGKLLSWRYSIKFDFPYPKRVGCGNSSTLFRPSKKSLTSDLALISKSRAIPIVVVAILALAYVLPGLIGHDPWKADEGYTFGNIFDLIQSGDWVVPHLAGEPFMEKPPFYHLVAAATATLMKPLLPLHDGARLASGLFMAITLLAVAWSARHSVGEGSGRNAVLMTLSAVGLVIHAHMMLTDLALMASVAIAMAGLVACARGKPLGGALLGTGTGMAFLAKGLIGPGAIGAASVCLPLAFAQWRTKGYVKQIWIAAIAVSPWFIVWPLALYLRSPNLFWIWLWDNNIGRFFGFSVHYLGARHEAGFWWRTYPWFLFPLWIFVVPLFWRMGHTAWKEPAIQIGGTLAATTVIVLALSASAREVYALPLLPPLALIATAGIAYAPRWLDRSLTALGIAISAVALILFWFCWGMLTSTGMAPGWLWLTRILPQQFLMPMSLTCIVVAGTLSASAVAVIIFYWRKTERGLLVWGTSLALGWGLAATLWLPWLDNAKSYRAMFESMQAARTNRTDCIASRGLGESERAMLEYVLGIVTERTEIAPDSNCATLLVQGSTQKSLHLLPSEWHRIWSGSRPSDTRERFDLFVRDRAPTVARNRQLIETANNVALQFPTLRQTHANTASGR